MAGRFKWVGLSEDGETITLRKFHGEFRLPSTPSGADPTHLQTDALAGTSAHSKTGIVLDVETTGLSKTEDRVIEIGMRSFRFDPNSGQLLELLQTYNALEDPGVPLSDEIKNLTGLSDQDLRGQKIDWQRVNSLLQGADLVIAHNAAFDRPFLDRKSLASNHCLWGCSLKQVDWQKKGYGIQRLELLCIFHGFFVDAHRAQNDVDGLLHLLTTWDAEQGRTYLAELYQNAQRPWTKLFAYKAPFESKDELRKRGYRWDAGLRVWIRTLFPDNLEAEKAWLESEVYRGPFGGQIQEIPVHEHFK